MYSLTVMTYKHDVPHICSPAQVLLWIVLEASGGIGQQG